MMMKQDRTKFKKMVLVYTNSQAPAFPSCYIVNAYTRNMSQSMGVDACYSVLVCPYRDGKFHAYFWQHEIDRIHDAFSRMICKDATIFSKCNENFIKLTDKLLNVLDYDVLQKKLSNYENQELINLLVEISSLYEGATYWAEPPLFTLEIGGLKYLKEQLFDFFENNYPELKSSQKEEIFNILCTSAEKTFVRESEESLITIALLDTGEQSRAIDEHVKKFYWIAYDYDGPILKHTDVEYEVVQLRALGTETLLHRLEAYSIQNMQAYDRLKYVLTTYIIPEELKLGFSQVRDLGFLYGNTKKIRLSQANVGIGLFLKEIAKRFSLEIQQLRYMTLDELMLLLDTGQSPDHTLLAQRKKHSMWIARDSKFFVANEDEEKEYTTYIHLSKQGSTTMFIKGQSACSGVYVGKVRILIDANKISNIQNGEILVTSMTNVSFVPAMKKAGAIVTDLGGITCHAAIVSRELGVPCVIGTGNATELLKDGDIVEVNASHGIIKILEKNS